MSVKLGDIIADFTRDSTEAARTLFRQGCDGEKPHLRHARQPATPPA